MEISELKNRIIESFSGTKEDLQDVLKLVESSRSVFPFNEIEFLVCSMIEKGGLTYNQYIELRSEYIKQNPNLWIFEISSPIGFGDKFAHNYLCEICPKLQKPSKILDSNFKGEYDLWLDGITIEVKASRAVDSDSNEPLYLKALARGSKKKFLMNFQQLKPQCCDVFIWLAVFRDDIVLWVISSKDVKNNPVYSEGQHRGNMGNEGQLNIRHNNINVLSEYELKGNNLEDAIRKAAKRNKY